MINLWRRGAADGGLPQDFEIAKGGPMPAFILIGRRMVMTLKIHNFVIRLNPSLNAYLSR